MRPKKTRKIECAPSERCFRPQCKPGSFSDTVRLSIDEFEAVRLKDVERLSQEEAALKMNISRPTFCRILGSARRKIAEALVCIKVLKIEGGCCEFETK